MLGAVNTLAAPHGMYDILHGESLHSQLLCLSVCLNVGLQIAPCNNCE